MKRDAIRCCVLDRESIAQCEGWAEIVFHGISRCLTLPVCLGRQGVNDKSARLRCGRYKG
jgi:hypothetical protein